MKTTRLRIGKGNMSTGSDYLKTRVYFCFHALLRVFACRSWWACIFQSLLVHPSIYLRNIYRIYNFMLWSWELHRNWSKKYAILACSFRVVFYWLFLKSGFDHCENMLEPVLWMIEFRLKLVNFFDQRAKRYLKDGLRLVWFNFLGGIYFFV